MMRSIKKRTTLNEHAPNTQPRLKRKHFSTNTMDYERANVVVQGILQTLLHKATAATHVLDTLRDTGWTSLLQNLKKADEDYCLVEDIVDSQPKCQPDEQPYPEQQKIAPKMNIYSHLKRMAIKTFEDQGEWNTLLQIDKKDNLADLNPKDKENLVQKMKRDCSIVRNSKYSSLSRPLGETRVFFKGEEELQLTNMRTTLQGQQTDRLRRISRLAKEQKRKANRLKTAFKKTKNLIDKIDPTGSIYLDETQTRLNRGYHKNSFSNMGLQSSQLQNSIMAEQTKFKQVTEGMKLIRDTKNSKKSIIQKDEQEERSYRLMNELVDTGREQLRLRLERSFHCSASTKLTQTVNRAYLGGSGCISVGLFPPISHR